LSETHLFQNIAEDVRKLPTAHMYHILVFLVVITVNTQEAILRIFHFTMAVHLLSLYFFRFALVVQLLSLRRFAYFYADLIVSAQR